MNAFKLSLAFLLGMFGFASTYAENKISVEDFTIASDGTYTVSVKMVNDPDVIALGCKITLPEGMTIVQQYDEYLDEDVDFILNSSRTYDPDQLYDEQVVQRHFIEGSYKPETNSYIIGVGHDDFMPFIGNSGEEIFHFVVKAEGALADASKILFTGIHFDKKNGTELTEVEQDDFEVNVTKVAVLEPTAIITTDADADGITIRPGAENRQIITVSMNNDCEVSGLSMKIVLPEGMQFVTGVEGFMAGISLNERAKGLKPNLNRTTGVLTLSQDSKKKTILPGEGEILAFLVEANNNLLAETQIDINTIRITTMYEGEVFTIRHDDKTIDVFNPAVAEKAAEEQAAAQDLVDETNGLAVDDKYKSYPDEDVQQKVTEAEAAIDAAKTAAEELKNLVDEKVADGTVLTDAAQEAITAKKDEVNAAIDAAEAAIAAVEEAYAAAEAAAKAEVEATIAALQERIDNAIPAEVAENPEVKNALVSANQAMDALKTALANADPVKENEDIAAKTAVAEQAVTTLEENAAAAKEAYDKKQANDAAFADLTAELDALRNAINAAIETVNTEAPDVKDEFVPELQKMLEVLDNTAANLQNQNLATALTDATTLEDLLKEGDVLPTQAAIDEVVENAKAAQADYANYAAYKELKDELANDVEAVVNDAKQHVAEEDKDVADRFTEDFNDIDALVEAIANEIEAAKEAGTAQDYAIDPEKKQEILDKVQALVEAADAAQAHFDANKEVYEALNELMDQLEDGLADATTALNNCPDVKDDFVATLDEIDQKIDDLQAAIDAANEAEALTEENDFAEQAEAIAAEIDKLVEDAAKAENAFIENKNAYENELDPNMRGLESYIADALAEVEGLGYFDESNAIQDIYGALKDKDDEVKALRDKLDAAKENVELTNLSDEDPQWAQLFNDELKDAIDALVNDAKAAQAAEEMAMTLANAVVEALKEKEAELEKTAADNDVAEEVKDELDTLKEAVDAVEQFVADNEGNFLDEEVQNAFVALGTAAADAFEAAEDAINRSIFNKYKDGKLAEADAQAEEGDSEASQKIISDAKDAIEALQYDDEKDLDANKAAIDAILEQMAEDLAAQRLIDSQTVGIFSLKAAIEGNVTIYDLNGRKVQKNQLKKGMYIINGKKVMVK